MLQIKLKNATIKKIKNYRIEWVLFNEPEKGMNALQTQLKIVAKKPLIKDIVKFFDGNLYPIVYAALILISSFFGLEFYIYILTCAIIVFTSLFSEDSKPIIVPIVLVVYSTSWKHTPQPPYNSQFLNTPSVLVGISVLAVIAVSAMIFRVVVFRVKEEGSTLLLKSGLIALSAAFILNGAISLKFEIKDMFFGALIALSFIAVYFYLSNTLRKNSANGKYCAYVIGLASAVIFIQLIYVLFIEGAFHDGTIDKDLVIAGWGMSNNVGGMLAMFLPATLYFSYKENKFGVLFYLLAFLQFFGVCLTQSRASVLIGGIILVAAAIVLSIVKTPQRKYIRICNIIVVIAAIFVSVLFFDKIKNLFAVMFDRGFSDSNRLQIWKNGLKNFMDSPLFGVGFYAPFYVDINIENWVFPDMYHNVFIQIIASCGFIGILAYAYHLSQVFFLALQKPSAERIFFLGMFLLITGTSLLDNHIFHVFPALVYSLILFMWDSDFSNISSLRNEWNCRARARFNIKF